MNPFTQQTQVTFKGAGGEWRGLLCYLRGLSASQDAHTPAKQTTGIT